MTSNRRDRATELSVLALIDHFVLGGAETLLARFAAAAWQAGIRLSLACLEELDGNPAAEPLYELGMPPVNLGVTGRPGLRELMAVRRHVAEVRPDIVHTHLGTSDVLGGVAARSLGVPAVCTLHTASWEPRAATRRRVVGWCDSRVIAVSECARQAYLAHGWARPDQVVTIHNGIDVTAVPGAGREVRAELGIGAEDLVVGMISALRPEKGHDVAIEAVALLRSAFPRLRLLIVGQGDLRAELHRHGGQILGDALVMTGLRHDVMRIFDAVDVCVQPSRIDAFPTTLIEAMAASVPVVASAVGGIPEMVSAPETGLLLPPPPDATAFAEALAGLLDNPARRRALAEAGRREYERRFTAGPWVRRTRALYDAVLAERGATPRYASRRAAYAGNGGGS